MDEHNSQNPEHSDMQDDQNNLHQNIENEERKEKPVDEIIKLTNCNDIRKQILMIIHHREEGLDRNSIINDAITELDQEDKEEYILRQRQIRELTQLIYSFDQIDSENEELLLRVSSLFGMMEKITSSGSISNRDIGYLIAKPEERLELLNYLINWKVCVVKNNIFIYERQPKGYYMQLSEPEALVVLQSIYKSLPPSKINQLLKSFSKQKFRLIEESTFTDNLKHNIPFQNGVYSFANKELRDYNEDDYFVNPFPHHYSPLLQNKANEDWFLMQCTKWLVQKEEWPKYIDNDKLKGNVELHENVKWFVKLLAYLLFCFPNYHLEQIWVNLLGRGQNGKSLLVWLIQEMHNQGLNSAYWKTTTFETSINKFSTSAYYGKHSLIGYDCDAKIKLKAAQVIKQITGDETISIEFKGKTKFPAYNTINALIVCTNDLIDCKEQTYAFNRRLIPI